VTQSVGIFQADCRYWLREVPPGSVHGVITDPPYGIDGMGDDWSSTTLEEKAAKAGVVGGLPVGMKFDPAQGERLREFLRPVFALCLAALMPGAFLVSFAQPRLFPWAAMAAYESGFEVREQAIWEHGGGQGKAFTQDHFVRRMAIPQEEKDALIAAMAGLKTPQPRPEFESILVAQKPREGTFVENWRKYRTGLIRTDFSERTQQGSIFRFPKEKDGVPHPSVKPVKLMERLIEVYTLPGQTVVDPFLGSGSTAVAAVRTGRKFLGCDIDKGYVRLAQERVAGALREAENGSRPDGRDGEKPNGAAEDSGSRTIPELLGMAV
jgi:site-specific DNA-methyltransferase (adenine-specific)